MNLPFILFKNKLDKDWVLGHALKLNNLSTIPMKILEVVETEKQDGHYLYSIEVEDCADKKEWEFLVKCFHVGSTAQAELNIKTAREYEKRK